MPRTRQRLVVQSLVRMSRQTSTLQLVQIQRRLLVQEGWTSQVRSTWWAIPSLVTFSSKSFSTCFQLVLPNADHAGDCRLRSSVARRKAHQTPQSGLESDQG